MKIRILLTALLVSTISVSCGESRNKLEDTIYKPLALVSEIKSVQPMTGIVLWTDNPKNNTDAVALEYSYMLYKDIVKSKGVYDWTPLDNLLEAVAARKHHLVLRFRYVYVGDRESAVPQYIRDLPDYEETIGMSEGRETCFLDWRHPELQRFHLEFYRKLAERYNKDKRIAFLQTGFGLWAEYHIYDGPFIMGRTFPSTEFQSQFFRLMDEVFTDLTWSISIDAASEEYSPFIYHPDLLDLNFGVFDDSFMHETHDEYNTTNWNLLDRNRYRKAPAGGEFGYYTKYDQENVLNKNGIHGRTFESEAEKFHITYMIGNDQPKYQSMDRIKAAGMACGYKYQITKFGASSDSVLVEVRNTGVAPIYRDAYITVDGIRSTVSLRKLQPRGVLTVKIPKKTDKPHLTIECDYLLDGQTIEFNANLK